MRNAGEIHSQSLQWAGDLGKPNDAVVKASRSNLSDLGSNADSAT